MAQRWMIGVWNHGIRAAIGEPWTQHQRIGDETAYRVASRSELRRLGDGIAQYQLRSNGVPQSTLAQHGLSRLAVGGDLGVRNREPAHAARLHEARQTVEPFVNRQRRTGGRKDDQASDGVDHARITRQASGRELVRKLFVGREEQLERRAVLDLARQRARRAEHNLDASATIARKLIGDLGEREIEIGCRSDHRRALSLQFGSRPDQDREHGDPEEQTFDGM